MNKQGKTSSAVMGIWVIALVALFGLGFMVYGQFKNQAIGDGTVTGDIAPGTVTSQLYGKAATISLSARDKSADDTSTRRTAPAYVVDPTGNYVYSGTALSATAATDFTSGVAVSTKPYKVAAFNGTVGSVNGLQDVMVTTERVTADIPVYNIGTATLTLYDDSDLALSTTQANVTMGAGETYSFSKLRIKDTTANTAFRVVGLYLDLDANTNISSVAINDNKVDAEGSFSLRSISTDDKNWKLKTPQLLYEYEYLDIGSISVTANGNNPSEAFTLYVADGEYYFSSQNKGVVFGSETDGSTSSDVGATNPSLLGRFN